MSHQLAGPDARTAAEWFWQRSGGRVNRDPGHVEFSACAKFGGCVVAGGEGLVASVPFTAAATGMLEGRRLGSTERLHSRAQGQLQCAC